MAGCSRLFVPVGPINFFNSRFWFINSSQCISMKAKKSMEESLFPKKPKRPLTPFFKYLQVMRPCVINEFPQFKTTEVVKKISEKWAIEDPDYKLKLHQEYDVEYKEYMKKVIEYEKSITPEQREKLLAIEDKIRMEMDKAKRKHNLQLLGKPKRPPSAFLLYINEQLKAGKRDTSIKEFVKNLSSQWKNINEQDKKPYQNRAAELMEKYNKEKTEWEQKMIQEDICKAKETHGKAANDVLLKVQNYVR